MTLRIGLLLLGLGLVMDATSLSAQEINARRHLDPALQVKVNKVMARAMRERGSAKSSYERSGSGSDCGDLVVGGSSDDDDSPDEVIIVADTIININKNCRR